MIKNVCVKMHHIFSVPVMIVKDVQWWFTGNTGSVIISFLKLEKLKHTPV